MDKHATISAWQREEDGSYKAEIDGWTMEVHWHPEVAGKRRGYSWTAKPAEGAALRGGEEEPFEEIEIAMADAEEAARMAGIRP